MSTLSKVMTGAFVAALSLVVPQAQALLVDRGAGMLYDDVLQVTWLQDANYAKTSGYDADGRMDWTQANTWVNGLVYGGYSDWRLARNSPVNGTPSGWNYTYSYAGTTDISYNITSTFSELPYMYYVNLGLKGAVNPDGSGRSDYGVNGNGTSEGQKDVGLVKNLQSYVYLSGTAYAPSQADNAWVFYTNLGYQSNYFNPQSNGFYAWAVRPGDVTVAAVPVPGSVALLAGGLALLGVMTRRRGRLGASEA